MSQTPKYDIKVISQQIKPQNWCLEGSSVRLWEMIGREWMSVLRNRNWKAPNGPPHVRSLAFTPPDTVRSFRSHHQLSKPHLWRSANSLLGEKVSKGWLRTHCEDVSLGWRLPEHVCHSHSEVVEDYPWHAERCKVVCFLSCISSWQTTSWLNCVGLSASAE